MDLGYFKKVESFSGIEGLSIEQDGSFEVMDETKNVYIKHSGDGVNVFKDVIGIFNIRQFCGVLSFMGSEAEMQHVMSGSENFLKMKSPRKSIEYTVSAKESVENYRYKPEAGHLLDNLKGIPTKLSIKLSMEDRREIYGAFKLLSDTAEASFEQREDGFFFVVGKGARTKCEFCIHEGNYAEIGGFSVSFKKDYLNSILNAASENAEFIFNAFNGGSAPLQVNDGALTYALMPSV